MGGELTTTLLRVTIQRRPSYYIIEVVCLDRMGTGAVQDYRVLAVISNHPLPSKLGILHHPQDCLTSLLGPMPSGPSIAKSHNKPGPPPIQCAPAVLSAGLLLACLAGVRLLAPLPS